MEKLLSTKASELFYAFLNGSPIMQYQAFNRIVELIQVEYASNDLESSKLIKKLIECLREEASNNRAILIVDLLLSCYQSGQIEFDFLMDSLLSQIIAKYPSSKACLRGITKLLILNRHHCAKTYGLTHPYLEVLRNTSDSNALENYHVFLLNEIDHIYSSIPLDEANTLLRPFYFQVFTQPKSVDLKHHAGLKLLRLTETGNEDQSLQSLINLYLDFLKPSHTVSNAFGQVLEVLMLRSKHQYSWTFIDKLMDVLVAMDQQGLSIGEKIDELAAQIQENQELNSPFVKLAAYLPKISLANILPYLALVRLSITGPKNTKLTLAIFLPCLFEFSSFLAVLKHNEHVSTIKKSLSELIKLIHDKLSSLGSEGLDDLAKKVNECSELTTLFNNEAESTFPGGRLTSELNALNVQRKNYLEACFLVIDETRPVTRLADLLQHMVTHQGHSKLEVFCLFMYKIKISSNYEIINQLLKRTSYLVQSSQSEQKILGNFVNLLTELRSMNVNNSNVNLNTICLRLLTNIHLANNEQTTYQYLLKELTVIKEQPALESSNQQQLNLKIMFNRALCIYDFIKYRPDYYVKDFLATISYLINNNHGQKYGGTVGVLLRCLAKLCEAEVLDLLSTWNALTKHFVKENRQPVLKSYCFFISVVSKLDDHYKYLGSANPDERAFLENIMRILWTFFETKPVAGQLNANFSIAKHPKLTDDVLVQLSHFSPTNFKIGHFPVFVQEKLKEKYAKVIRAEENAEKSLDEIFPKIPSSCHADLLDSIDVTQSSAGACRYIENLLVEELNNMPRRNLSQAAERIISSNDQLAQFNKIQDIIYNYLSDLRSGAKRPDPESNFLLFLFRRFETVSPPNNQKLLKEWKSFKTDFSEILSSEKEASRYEDLELFRNGLYELMTSALKFGCQIVSSKVEPGQEKKEKLETVKNESVFQIRDEVMTLMANAFKNKSDNSYHVQMSYIHMLSALVNASTDILTSEESKASQLQSDQDLSKLTLINKQRKWLQLIVDLILNMNENSIKVNPNSASEIFQQFSYNEAIQIDSFEFLCSLFNPNTKQTLSKKVMNLYFLTSINMSCKKLSINNYLIKYIEETAIDSFWKVEPNNENLLNLVKQVKSVAVFIIDHIRNENSVSLDLETAKRSINAKLVQFTDKFFRDLSVIKTRSLNVENSSALIESYLEWLTKCFFYSYQSELMNSDNHGLLIKLLNFSKAENFSFLGASQEGSDSLSFAVAKCHMNLLCLSYKFDLVDGQQLDPTYEDMNKNHDFLTLAAFYARYLAEIGYSNAFEWLKSIHSKCMSSVNDFRRGLNEDLEALERNILISITLATGFTYHNYYPRETSSPFTVEIDKIVKPEQTLRDVLGVLSRLRDPKNASRLNRLHEIMFQSTLQLLTITSCNMASKIENVYSAPTTFDYLDDSSVLRNLFDDLVRLMSSSKQKPQFKSKSSDQIDEAARYAKIDIYLKAIISSVEKSSAKSLPPINWYFLMTAFLKYDVEKRFEHSLVRITLLHLAHSKSACMLLKNLLIDTNSLLEMRPQTQLEIFGNLDKIVGSFEESVLKKFMVKLKNCLGNLSKRVFTSNEGRVIFYQSLDRVVDGFLKLFQSKASRSAMTEVKKDEVIETIIFLYSQFEFNLESDDERSVIDKVGRVLIELNDDKLDELLMTSCVLAKSESISETTSSSAYAKKILSNSYLRLYLIANFNKPLSMINDSIEEILYAIDELDAIVPDFLSIFVDSIILLNNQVKIDDSKTPGSTKVINTKGNLTEWFLKFLEKAKELIAKNDKDSSIWLEKIRFAFNILGHFAFAINSFEPSAIKSVTASKASAKTPNQSQRGVNLLNRQITVGKQDSSRINQNMSFNLRQLFKNQSWCHGQHQQIYLSFIQWANYCLGKFISTMSTKTTSSLLQFESSQLIECLLDALKLENLPEDLRSKISDLVLKHDQSHIHTAK